MGHFQLRFRRLQRAGDQQLHDLVGAAVDALDAGVNWAELPVYLVGVVTAAVVGYLCIRLLKMIADKGKFGFFAYYCWGVALFTFILNLLA